MPPPTSPPPQPSLPPRLPLLAVSAALALLCGACTPQEAPTLRIKGETMGTWYAVTVVEAPSAIERDALQRELEQILAAINQSMSSWLPDSELSRFNRHRTDDWFAVSAQLAEVTDAALALSRLSDGAFDVTVGPLVDLWGFGGGSGSGDGRPQQIPPEAQLQAVAQRIGYANLRVRREPPALRKLHPGVHIDLSAIAKGYAVDALAEHLRQRRVTRFLVDIGGELRGAGANPRGKPWQIAIEQPQTGAGGRAVQAVIETGEHGVATSGDYRNYFERDGMRFSHTIDPQTLRPVTHGLASVTVVAPDTMHADGLATMFMVLGEKRGMELAEARNIAVHFIAGQGRREDQGFRVSHSPAFAVYLQGGAHSQRE